MLLVASIIGGIEVFPEGRRGPDGDSWELVRLGVSCGEVGEGSVLQHACGKLSCSRSRLCAEVS